MCEHVPLTCLMLVWVSMICVYSMCLRSCMHGYVLYASTCTSSPLGQMYAVISSLLSWCGLSAGDLAQSHWRLMPNMLLACLRSRPHSHCWLLTSQVCFMSSIQDINMGKTQLQHMSRASDSSTTGCKNFVKSSCVFGYKWEISI